MGRTREALQGVGAGVDIVVSSAFETSLGLAHLAACAGALGGGRAVSHGLATYGRLGGDIMGEGLGACVLRGGRLDLLHCERMVQESKHTMGETLSQFDQDDY